MINFTTLTLRNFLSFGNAPTTVLLNQPGTTLILGEDLDNTVNGQGVNGCGKTVLINALSYALYDKPVSNISKDNLVNNINKKNMEVSVEFEKDEKKYKVIRARKMKAGATGNYVQLFEDDKEITLDSIANTTEHIEKILGLPYELFVRIVVFSASLRPFLELPLTSHYDANQTDIIEELFDLTTLSEKAVALKETIKETEQRIEVNKARIGAMEEEQSRQLLQIESAKRRVIQWETQNRHTLKELEDQLVVVKNTDIDQQETLLSQKTLLEDDIKIIENNLAPVRERITSIKNDIKEKESKKTLFYNNVKSGNKNVERTRDLVKTTSSEITDKREQKEHLLNNVCPTCSRSWTEAEDKISEYDSLIDELTSKLATFESLIENTNIEIETFNKNITETEADIKEKTKELVSYETDFKQFEKEKATLTIQYTTIKKSLFVQSKDELYVLKSQETTIGSKIEELRNNINPFIEPLTELEELSKTTIDYDELNKLTRLSDHQKFLLKLLTKKDSFVRKVLINKNIPYLNNRLQHYLVILGLPHKVEFTHEMKCQITQFGNELDFGNLSAGQRARVNLALSFAFRDVLQNMHTHINICLLDEVLDVGLDAIGVQAAARLLKRKARDENLSLFIISHRNEIDSAFDRTMMIQLSKGFSYVKPRSNEI